MDYLKVAAAKPSLKVADIGYNLREIVNLIRSMEAEGIRLAVFPELCITGYTSADLFLTGDLLQKSLTGLEALATELEGKEIAIAVGLPRYT
jgi:NAD+ synthase (glutamine-hydrolysing)